MQNQNEAYGNTVSFFFFGKNWYAFFVFAVTQPGIILFLCGVYCVGHRPVEEANKMKCYKRVIYKQFVQISGLCGHSF